MWSGMDPELVRQLAALKKMVGLSQRTPTKEWPLTFVKRFGGWLVVREWPDGSITAYVTSERIDNTRHNGT